MQTLIYDGSFEGLLSAVFYIYEYKLTDAHIYRNEAPPALFGNTVVVDSDLAKAERVWNGLAKLLSSEGLNTIYSSYLADTLQEENNILAYMRYAFSAGKNIEADYSNFAVLRAQQVARMVSRERHRMKAFVRFMLTKDGIYYAHIEPDFNVLPLIKSHFENRYADQRWIIYDHKRNYGLYYDLNKTETITLHFSQTGSNMAINFDENEEAYQNLWRQYFKSVNIADRKNMKLHIQHVPRRYWHLLSEKQTGPLN